MVQMAARASLVVAPKCHKSRTFTTQFSTTVRQCSRPCLRQETNSKVSSPLPMLRRSYSKTRCYASASNQASHISFPVSSISSTPILRSRAHIEVNGTDHEFSSVLLRDLCECPACVHESTKQKLYSTADIPIDVTPHSIRPSKLTEGAYDLGWSQDVPGYGPDHVTTLTTDVLQELVKYGTPMTPFSIAPSTPMPWDASSSSLPDCDYQAYMEDDAALLRVIEQLQTHGLAFITGVPGIEKSVATIAERIGPIKDTFYGQTWDVRTVPKAINAAYTNNDLGFHTDLLYFDNPPHIQLLHCIQSSSSGGASIFADAFKCALDLYEQDEEAFNVLATTSVNYHYKHIDSNLYAASKPVFDMRPLRIGNTYYDTLREFLAASEKHRQDLYRSTGMRTPKTEAIDCLEKINWGPPFMAPFSIEAEFLDGNPAGQALNDKIDAWHDAAKKFAKLLERPHCLHERLMKPGECVLFNNTRVLHSRRAFNADDVGKARWLRGTYVDKDPFFSKLRVLSNRDA